MKFTPAIITILSLLVVTCNNLDNADPSPRNTFIKFYEGPYSITASSVEIVPDGFVILGNMLVEDNVNDTTYIETVVIKTDKNGNQIGDFNRSQGGTGKAIKPLFNGSTIEGYIVVGDSIYSDPLAEQAANVSVSSLRLLLLDANFQFVDNVYFTDTSAVAPNLVREDYTGESITIASDGRIIILGTRKAGVANQLTTPAEPFIAALTIDRDSIDWFKRYELNGKIGRAHV